MKSTLFSHADFGALRVFEGENGPWISAGDVCLALGLSNASQAVASLDDDEKGVITADTLGGPQEIRTVNESAEATAKAAIRNGRTACEQVAANCYEMADAMLAARGKEEA